MQTLPPLSAVIEQFGLNARKSLGQHFLLDQLLLERIVAEAGDLSDCHVIEIGPGPGGLTRALLTSNAKTVTSIETDVRCVEALQSLKVAYGERFRLVHDDALKSDLTGLAARQRKIIANLPYNIGTALLVGWLHEIADDVNTYQNLTLMFQKEVAERITASPCSKAYGRLSVLSQFLCDVRDGFDIPPGAFTPPPKVISRVITLTPRKIRPSKVKLESLERVVASAFGQRRKMLRQSLKSLGLETAELLQRADIDGTRRAETLSVAEFCRLTETYESLVTSDSR